MQAIGEIVEILSQEVLLIKSEKNLKTDQIVVVFERKSSSDLLSKYQLPHIDFPKGEVQIFAKQADHFFLAKSFRPQIETAQEVLKSPFGLFSGLYEQKVIYKNAPGDVSAKLAPPSFELSYDRQVKVGDLIGEKE